MSNEILQWYPGHMEKTHRQIEKNLKNIDVIIEVLDARAPFASSNPRIGKYYAPPWKKRIVLLNKADLADSEETDKWVAHLQNNKDIDIVLPYNALEKNSSKKLIDVFKDYKSRSKCLVVGIPNVGKSAVINSLVGTRKTVIGDKPGVTKNLQWLKGPQGIYLLDSPGILWPRFDDQEAAKNLCWINGISEKRYEIENIAGDVLKFLVENYPDRVKSLYSVEFEDEPVWEIFDKISDSRKHFKKGKEYDYERTSRMILKDFRDGKLGPITIEKATGYSTYDNIRDKGIS